MTKLQVPHSYRADTITTANNGLGYRMPFTFYFPEPYFIPLGSRIAVRATDSIASAITYGGVKILYQEGTAPTVALNTPSDASSGSTTPVLNFTGTDAESDAVEYEVQIDTANTFDSSSTPALIAYYSESNKDMDGGAYAGSDTDNAQSFTGVAGNLSSAKFYLKKTGTPTGAMTAVLYAHTGTFGSTGVPTGTALATSDTIDISTLTTSYALVEFAFTGVNQYTLVAGTNYFISCHYNGGDASNRQNLGYDNTGAASGNLAYGTPGAWTTLGTADVCFYVYTLTPAPLVDALSATGSGFTAGHPFASATAIDYTASTLASGTYYWRVRAIDPLGTNTYGAWSSTRSFVIAGATLTATVQNYVLTGQSANFKRAISLTATAQSYALTGVSATLRYGHLFTATAQSYAVTTVPANFKKALKLTATAQSYTLTGVAVNLKRGYTLTATVQSYALTGVASNLKRGYTLTATVRSYDLTGIANNYLRDRVMPATAQSYALTGIAANLVRNTTLTATVRSYALTGVAINVKRNYTLTATARSYALTGTATGLLRGRRLTATQQNYALSGSATSLSVNYRLTATVQTYAITGTANALKRGYTLTATVRSYTIAGVDINVKRNYTLAATVRSFTLAFINANLVTEGNYR
ncbi:MAG: hypothetical protein J0651_03150, partial [Actinobacteria bacterium]|nr:hypothetical protein [Actinomycetota bacterium]